MEEYFQRQRDLRRESQGELASLASVPLAAGIAMDDDRPTSDSPKDRDLPVDKPKIFVVMPFSEPWSAGIYDFIRRAVRSLDLSDERVFRADDITAPGRIDQQIVDALRASDLVIGDITEVNPNVMWELGFAEASDTPIVILNQRIDESPFDLANSRQVVYRSVPTDDDEKKLAGHIGTALEMGRDPSSIPAPE